MDVFGIFAGSLVDHLGYRPTSLIGAVITIISLVLAAFSTQVWHLYLTQWLLYGTRLSLTFFVPMPLPLQWFTKNRGLATRISVSGAGIGGFWISPIVGNLLHNRRFKFTALTLAVVHIVLLLPAGFLYRTRLETGRQRAKRIKRFGYREGESRETIRSRRKFVELGILKDRWFCLLVMSGVFNACANATQHNMNKSTVALMVGLMNGSTAVGRIVMGFILDRIGSINAFFISTFAASLTVFFLWMFAETSTMMIVFSVAYGFCAGA
ncbi:hypothetical protein BGW39_008852 [Mortierella sp. 14UC]|nr:hypothetical protein BGW39_008852 [Mortierella sp. 14UC]